MYLLLRMSGRLRGGGSALEVLPASADGLLHPLIDVYESSIPRRNSDLYEVTPHFSEGFPRLLQVSRLHREDEFILLSPIEGELPGVYAVELRESHRLLGDG